MYQAILGRRFIVLRDVEVFGKRLRINGDDMAGKRLAGNDERGTISNGSDIGLNIRRFERKMEILVVLGVP